MPVRLRPACAQKREIENRYAMLATCTAMICLFSLAKFDVLIQYLVCLLEALAKEKKSILLSELSNSNLTQKYELRSIYVFLFVRKKKV